MKFDANKRKTVYLGAAALVATGTGGGAGFAWWKHHMDKKRSMKYFVDLWNTELATPEGKVIKMADFQGQRWVLNLWATWCAPCVEEMPLIDLFYRQHREKGWQVLGIAMDQPSSIRQYLKRSPVSYPIAMGGIDVARFNKILGNESGSLPFTVIFDEKKQIVYKKLGKLSVDDIRKWVV